MTKTLHMIGNAHIDPVWLWRWQEGLQEIKATFRSALDRIAESEDFVFTATSAAFYAWIEDNEPEMFAEIRQRVHEGRWEIAGGWWVEPDCNIPSGESFVRQGLYGQRYFESRFGAIARVGLNPDSFGHHAMLPQILKKSGLDSYVFMRPGPHEKELPARLFWWESADGSRVLTFRIPFEYCTGREDVEAHVRRCAAEIREPVDELMCFYGVGNHGGGPTKRDLDCIRRLGAQPDVPRLVLSTPSRFFRSIADESASLPVVRDELQMHAVGCYAAHSGIKSWNRAAETLLVTAEKLSAVASRVTARPYPDDFERAWRNVLFNQFHDILAGTSLESAYDDARDAVGEAMSIGARALNHAVQSISWRVGIAHEEGVKPIVVINPHAWPARGEVELEIGGLEDSDVLVDDEGEVVPLQTIRSHASVASWRKRISFVADLPPLGYRTFRVRPATSGVARDGAPAIAATDTTLESDTLRVEIDAETGFLVRLQDKRNGADLLEAPARPVILADRSDTWSHGVVKYDEEIGDARARSVRLVEHGPVRSTIRVESAYGASTIVQELSLHRGLDQLQARVTVDWRERHEMLKLRFPLSLRSPRATFEAPYGHVERAGNGHEVPGQSWLDLTGTIGDTSETCGVGLLNDGKHSFDVHGSQISMTVLRSPIYAHHDPYVPDADGAYSYIDQGVQRFTYVLVPHAGDWRRGELVRRAAELNQPPIPILETFHDGPLPQTGSFASIDADNVVLAVLKKAEDGDALIVRCYEAHGVATRTSIRLDAWDRTIDARLDAFEIKTLRVPRSTSEPVIEVDLLERPL